GKSVNGGARPGEGDERRAKTCEKRHGKSNCSAARLEPGADRRCQAMPGEPMPPSEEEKVDRQSGGAHFRKRQRRTRLADDEDESRGGKDGAFDEQGEPEHGDENQHSRERRRGCIVLAEPCERNGGRRA